MAKYIIILCIISQNNSGDEVERNDENMPNATGEIEKI